MHTRIQTITDKSNCKKSGKPATGRCVPGLKMLWAAVIVCFFGMRDHCTKCQLLWPLQSPCLGWCVTWQCIGTYNIKDSSSKVKDGPVKKKVWCIHWKNKLFIVSCKSRGRLCVYARFWPSPFLSLSMVSLSQRLNLHNWYEMLFKPWVSATISLPGTAYVSGLLQQQHKLECRIQLFALWVGGTVQLSSCISGHSLQN